MEWVLANLPRLLEIKEVIIERAGCFALDRFLVNIAPLSKTRSAR